MNIVENAGIFIIKTFYLDITLNDSISLLNRVKKKIKTLKFI